ncbi:MAG: phytanoyl-CoA dioxygenase family protein [Acidimicrobiales bacterium]|nr:phytanoyl-CoA dioxygenase family protein [Acidimicrobiales bacterium]
MSRHPWNTEFTWTRPATPPRRLTLDEVDQFHREGYVVIENLVADHALAELTAELDDIEAGVDDFVKALPDERMFIAESGAIIFSPHAVKVSPAARRVSRDRAVVEVVRDLIGPDVRLYWDQIVYKKPEKPRRFPFHQDNGYGFVEPQQYLTCWVALTDATIDNGCTWIVPGVHLEGTLAHEYIEPLGFECFEDHPDMVPVEAPAGSVVVFSSLTPHMTGANTTDDVRKSYILQYASDGSEVLRGEPDAPPEKRERNSHPDRQFFVVQGGKRVD